MKRRAALAALAAGWGGLVPLVLGQAAAPARDTVLAWGPAGCCVGRPDGELQALPDVPAAGVAPVPTALGLWLVDVQGRLRGWAPGEGHAWQRLCTVALPQPVHALSASADGLWAAAAHGELLSLVNARGEVVKTFEGRDLARKEHGAANALFALPRRRSLVAAWPALGELWEISLDPGAPPIFDGLVHDYRMGEAIATPGYLGARRSPLGRPLAQFSHAGDDVAWLAGVQGSGVVIVHLDVRRRIATLPVEAARPAAATLHPGIPGVAPPRWWLPAGPEVHVFDPSRWLRVARLTLPGTVQQLQVVGDAVWALAGEGSAAALWRQDDAGGWRRLPGLGGPVIALRAAARGLQALVLSGDPPALLQLDRSGSVLHRWALPADTAWQGVAGWPES